MSEHLRCQVCGGSVVYDVVASGAACMFCGAVALVAAPPEETVPNPHASLVFEVAPARADDQYRQWAQASWFYPKVLRTLAIKLQPMFLPVWRFDSEVETHWAGLRRAHTRSGKEPVSGQSHAGLRQMIPASTGLRQDEVDTLQPFPERGVAPWDAAATHYPWEPPGLSEQRARVDAHGAMAQRHAQRIAQQHQLIRCLVSPVVQDRDVKLLMVPIYIGAFRFRKRPWRFVINAVTGEVAGKAPIDRVKVAVLVLGGLALIAAAVALVLWHS